MQRWGDSKASALGVGGWGNGMPGRVESSALGGWAEPQSGSWLGLELFGWCGVRDGGVVCGWMCVWWNGGTVERAHDGVRHG